MLDFKKLMPHKNREFVPANMDFNNINQITEQYAVLQSRDFFSSKDLEKWLLDRSEFEAAFDQLGSILYIEMTCQTDDKDKADAYTNFISKIVPVVKPLEDQLNRKFLAGYNQYGLDDTRYAIYVRDIRTDIELFVEENIPLQTKVDLLSQEYQKICGAMTVDFEGKEHTLPEMSKYLLETDRSKRENAWRAVNKRRLMDKDKIDLLFDEMVTLRHKIAQNAGFKNYMEYKFKALHRFDYTAEDCKSYHHVVEEIVVPIAGDILRKRKEQMSLGQLRPWDVSVDPLGRDALKPFEKVEDLIGRCMKIFKDVDDELGQQFSKMAEIGLLDLGSRKGKAPGGYQSALSDSRMPFIFMNAVGVDGDVRTLLHEGGHSFHSWACVDEPLLDYRHAPMEFCEVASMTMELLGGKHLSAFYSSDDVKRSTIEHLEDIVSVLTWVATIDAFQHWIYENPKHAREDRKQEWMAIRKRFGSGVIDWTGLDEEEVYMWHRQLHIFEVPFYYIEYAIAQLGALQIWANSKQDNSKAIRQYKAALSLGGSRGLPVLFEIAGIKFDFTESTIEPLVKMISAELVKLDG